MEILLVLIGLMLLTVVVAAVGDRVGLPWPALLTLLTTCVIFIPGMPDFDIPADLILPIFLPPLLWTLARRTSWGVIREQWLTIALLSVGLVVVTTLAVGFTAYALLPGIGMAGAILIGAATAPPDPVAVEAVAEPAGIPRRIISTLQTEGLFNDAASIVAFHLALYAVTLGDDLSFGKGVIEFAYNAGVAVVLGYVIGRLAAWFMGRVEESTYRNALTWVIPFATYLLAEEVRASGVIAVVVAAIELHSRAAIEAEDRLSGHSFWETVEMLFTGVAFGLIGLTVNTAIDEVGADLWHSVMVGVVLSLVLFAVRGAWMYMYYRINRRSRRTRVAPLRLQEVLLMTWSGMRGLVTLALVLAVPAGAFPFHHELAVIALTVLLMTMVLPGLGLPWLMKRLDLASTAEAAADKMRSIITTRARKAAMTAVRTSFKESDPEAAASVDAWFDNVFGPDHERTPETEARLARMAKVRAQALETRRIAYTAAQAELIQMRRESGLNPALVDEVLAEVDRMVLVSDHR